MNWQLFRGQHSVSTWAAQWSLQALSNVPWGMLPQIDQGMCQHGLHVCAWQAFCTLPCITQWGWLCSSCQLVVLWPWPILTSQVCHSAQKKSHLTKQSCIIAVQVLPPKVETYPMQQTLNLSKYVYHTFRHTFRHRKYGKQHSSNVSASYSHNSWLGSAHWIAKTTA